LARRACEEEHDRIIAEDHHSLKGQLNIVLNFWLHEKSVVVHRLTCSFVQSSKEKAVICLIVKCNVKILRTWSRCNALNSHKILIFYIFVKPIQSVVEIRVHVESYYWIL